MATLIVTTASDLVSAGDGKLSLREAVTQANATAAADTIVFASALEGQTLTLTGGELVVSADLTIDGNQDNNASSVILDGNSASRILRVSTNSANDVNLTDLTFQHGYVENRDGGAIFVGAGNLTINNCEISENRSLYGNGGAIAIQTGSRVAINETNISDNYSTGAGAIISNGNVLLTIRNSLLEGNVGYYGGGVLHMLDGGTLTMEDSIARGNGRYGGADIASGGVLLLSDSTALVSRSALLDNKASDGGAISSSNSNVTVVDSTIAGNAAGGPAYGIGGGINVGYGSHLVLRNSTVTANRAYETSGDSFYTAMGGGISVFGNTKVDISNSIVAGNQALSTGGSAVGFDIYGPISTSNGHNVFGTNITGNVAGDLEGVAPNRLFASLDPTTGGGLATASGIVLLLSSATNPALSGADPLAAGATGQLGGSGRPLPAGSLADLGAIEINRAPSASASANNDVLTGTASANTISGLAGADYLKGQGGNDTLNGGDGGDLLDGGTGNDQLRGDGGIDLVFYGGTAKVTVDLSLAADKATRGAEVDSLFNIEGAIGSAGADTLKGNEFSNFFQGGQGKDTFTGGGARDLYDFNSAGESGVGSNNRDVITDFAHLTDDIDLMGIDANGAISGNQNFRFVGTTALGGAGEVGYFTSGGNTIIRGSTDADIASEFEIQLSGIKTLTAEDFYL